jgi:3-oxoadipate enol-lactonase
MWDDQVGEFAMTNTVLRYDLRGFGRSDQPSAPFSHAADLHDLLQSLGLERTSVVGVSYGGRVALDFSLTHPEMVEALVLVGAGLGCHDWSEPVKRYLDEEDAAVERGDLDHATELNLEMWVDGPHRTPDQVDPVVRQRVREMQLDLFGAWVAQAGALEWEQELEPAARERLGEINAPTLVVVGEKDVDDIHELAERQEAEIPSVTKAVIRGAAHVPNMEKPREFNELVLGFLHAHVDR